MSGKPGGFVAEVRKGTNFAHVIEHVILELIHLADPEKQRYTGWTRQHGAQGQSYVIHYSAPSFLTGRLAAILGVDLVKKLVARVPVEVGACVELLKNPQEYFAQKERAAVPDRSGEPLSVVRGIEGAAIGTQTTLPRKAARLSAKQQANITSVLSAIKKHLRYITESWENSFLEYGGNFGRAIIDKIEWLNIDKFMDFLLQGDFDRFYRAVRNVSQITGSYRIPLNFIVHSIWLYKNRLLAYVIEEYKDEKTFLDQAVADFDALYQTVFFQVSQGLSEEQGEQGDRAGELKTFSEATQRKGYVLIVDDDEMVRCACRDILEYHGYWTLQARDGAEALEIFANKRGDITLVMLNVSLPDLPGTEVYAGIRELDPGMKFLIMTGHRNGEAKTAFDEGSSGFIRKPFSAEVLGEKIDLLMEAKPKVPRRR